MISRNRNGIEFRHITTRIFKNISNNFYGGRWWVDDGDGVMNESDHFFSDSKTGFVTEIIEDLVRKRIGIKKKMASMEPDSQEYKDLYNRQYALKILANASYGYYAYAGSRWYSRI